ncbi:MAG: hypothetical protein C4329_07180 [Chitinophagaceae bacterium]
MRFLLLIPVIAVCLFCSCSGGNANKPFCDTTCNDRDTFKFTNDHTQHPLVTISKHNCAADTLTWSHDQSFTVRQIVLPIVFDNPIKINKAAINCFIKDTTYAWLKFNDCKTGRGYLLKLPFNPKASISKISGAINNFDPKFTVEKDLVAYTDRGTIYVEDVNTGKKEAMTFKEEYPIDFDKIHETVDTANITHARIFVQLIKNGEKIPLEKKINL